MSCYHCCKLWEYRNFLSYYIPRWWEKGFGHSPLPHIRPLLLLHMKSIFLLSHYNHLSCYFVVNNWSIFHCSFFCKSIHQLIPHYPCVSFYSPLKCIIHFKCVSAIILFLMDSMNRLRLNLFCNKSKVILLSVFIATHLSLSCPSWSSCNFSKTFIKIALCSAWLLEQCPCNLNFSWCTNLPFTNIISAAPMLSPILLPSVYTSVVCIVPFSTSRIISSSAGCLQYLTSNGVSYSMSCLAEWCSAYLCLCLFYPVTSIASVWGLRFSQLWRFKL